MGSTIWYVYYQPPMRVPGGLTTLLAEAVEVAACDTSLSV
jgi:hypothetical protein